MALADRVVLNKVDLATPAERDEVRAYISPTSPYISPYLPISPHISATRCAPPSPRSTRPPACSRQSARRYREIWGRYREIWGRYRGDIGAQPASPSPSPNQVPLEQLLDLRAFSSARWEAALLRPAMLTALHGSNAVSCICLQGAAVVLPLLQAWLQRLVDARHEDLFRVKNPHPCPHPSPTPSPQPCPSP